jgi:hypothetical protein
MSIKELVLQARLFIVLALITALLTNVITPIVGAAPYLKLSTRSLQIGTSEPGAETEYIVSFSWPTSESIGSIRFILCLDYVVDQPCASTPDGDLSAAVLTAQTGTLSGTGGFTIDAPSTQVDELLLVRNFSTFSGTGMHSVTLDNIINPSIPLHRFYIQIFTYASIDGTGVPTHMSSVATSTTVPIEINTEVPPILYFCAALTVDPYCENTSGNLINYGSLSPTTGNAATSQFGVSTNAEGGYVVTINGNTMTSGFKQIPPTTIPDVFTTGVPQFGLNLRANTSPAIGADPVGLGIGTVDPDYDTPDVFQFVTNDIVATAANGTLFDTFTVTYIVNVPPDQAAGVYSTTIAFICTAAF